MNSLIVHSYGEFSLHSLQVYETHTQKRKAKKEKRNGKRGSCLGALWKNTIAKYALKLYYSAFFMGYTKDGVIKTTNLCGVRFNV